MASSDHDEDGEHGTNGERTGHLPSHAEGGGNGEEAGGEFTKDQTYDHARNGVRLELIYDTAANAFVGTVENTTKAVNTIEVSCSEITKTDTMKRGN